MDVHLPPEHYEAVEQRLYRGQHWNELFPGTEYERAIAECDLEPSEPVQVNGNIPLVHWLLERRYGQYVASLRLAHQRGNDRRGYGSEAQRIKWADTIPWIVVHNTANTKQPETIARHHITVIASQARLSPKETETGILAAERRGLIERTAEGEYRVGTN